MTKKKDYSKKEKKIERKQENKEAKHSALAGLSNEEVQNVYNQIDSSEDATAQAAANAGDNLGGQNRAAYDQGVNSNINQSTEEAKTKTKQAATERMAGVEDTLRKASSYKSEVDPTKGVNVAQNYQLNNKNFAQNLAMQRAVDRYNNAPTTVDQTSTVQHLGAGAGGASFAFVQ